MHPAHKKRNITIALIAIGVVCVGIIIWMNTHPDQPEQQSFVPETISSELLFSPYVPTLLPDGYKVDAGSYSVDDQALLFTAVDSSKRHSIVFSEQAMPKDFDMNDFHKTNITDAARLEGLKYSVIFGKITGQTGNIASVMTDGTWTLITLPEFMTKENAAMIASGLVRQ